MYEEKIFQTHSMSNVTIYDDQRFAIKNSGVSFVTSIFDFSQPKITNKHAKNQFKFAKYYNLCTGFLRDLHELIA